MSELKTTPPRIAIPVPHSGDREYAERALPQYEEAVRGAGGEPVRIELDQTPLQVMKQIEGCDAVLLPGSRADVDPRKYRADRHEKTAPADSKRELVDDLAFSAWDWCLFTLLRSTRTGVMLVTFLCEREPGHPARSMPPTDRHCLSRSRAERTSRG